MSKKISVSKACAVCGISLEAYHPTAKICHTPNCIRERNRLKAYKFGKAKLWGLPRVCPVCQKDFTCSKSHKKFCSKGCANHKEKA